jgi:hypothetical protein
MSSYAALPPLATATAMRSRPDNRGTARRTAPVRSGRPRRATCGHTTRRRRAKLRPDGSARPSEGGGPDHRDGASTRSASEDAHARPYRSPRGQRGVVLPAVKKQADFRGRPRVMGFEVLSESSSDFVPVSARDRRSGGHKHVGPRPRPPAWVWTRPVVVLKRSRRRHSFLGGRPSRKERSCSDTSLELPSLSSPSERSW